MRLKNLRHSRRLISLFLFVVALFIPRTFDERDILHANTYSSLSIDDGLLRNGDIIFRRGISFVSNLVLETDSRSPYSHVGIVKFDENKPFVIHAVPDESENGIDYIRKDPISLFLRKDRASAYAVYRCNDFIYAGDAAVISEGYYRSKILFDGSFDLFDAKEFYCTELVWRAYLTAGVDLTESVYDTLTIPIGSNPFLLPGTLLESSCLKQVTNSSIFQ